MVKTKDKDFTDVVPIIPGQISSRIMGSRIYGNEEPRFLWINHYDRFSVTGFRIDRLYTDKKIANNTKINHLMVYLTDHYTAISLGRLQSEIKIGKDWWYFNYSLLCKPVFYSATENLLFLFKNTKNNLIFSIWLVGIHQFLL